MLVLRLTLLPIKVKVRIEYPCYWIVKKLRKYLFPSATSEFVNLTLRVLLLASRPTNLILPHRSYRKPWWARSLAYRYYKPLARPTMAPRFGCAVWDLLMLAPIPYTSSMDTPPAIILISTPMTSKVLTS